jgi:N-acetylmuramoyl-L-alanine amidase
LTLNADVKDSTISRSNGIALQIFDPALYSASYYNVGDRYALILGGAILTRFTSPDFLKYYTESYSSDGLTYTVSYLTSSGDVGTGHISVNDIMVNDIDITKDGAYTKIIFHSKKRYKYNIFTKYNVNSGIVDSTSITVLNPAAPGEKLIVIDAGHGGYDPGAANDGSTEKYFNLDLALRLNALLKANGIKTYMIRSEDIDVNLRERVYIANQLNCAFYYCIHNNSVLALATGTETLYYSQDAKGFSIATTIEDELIATLNTTRRNVVSRDDLFVLNSTDAPAALSEILFMSNPDDLALLRDPDFRQRAAEAMYRGLVKSMGMF